MHVGQPKIDGSAFAKKMAPEAISEHLIFKNFLGEHALVLCACLLIFAYRHRRNPPSKILATDLFSESEIVQIISGLCNSLVQ